MKYVYTAVFTIENEHTVYARIPDLPGCITTGKDLNDALLQVTDAASIWLISAEDNDDDIPAPTPQETIRRENGQLLSLISIDTILYRSLNDTRAVRKNVSLPLWMVNLASKRGINCSKVLQQSLQSIFSNSQ
ncbi:MAG: type II toxin-antitoxin system HicB family antitoxin [Lachnospiraceae bacterium]|nr:type II toxin-antitoxin system HicB family antitoxin [Lachnospiraceae bacterium]MBQ9606943.1 type II toxin-antitoxin system HicB family antitoxin [Lachnospiraceae bacterium]MBR1523910.1 type II toxin-antitoxin system HicB family antitoxin [Lachnospiraceae bacterium]